MVKINKTINNIIDKINIVLFIIMLSIVFMQVVLRYFIGSSLSGSEEASRYLLFFLVLLGASACVHDNSHLKISYFYERFSPIMQRIAGSLISASVLVSSVVFIYYGWDLTLKTMSQTTPSLQLPKGLIFAGFPVAGALIAFFQAQHLIRIWSPEK